ncbi:hypothetical protein VN12_14345 [Pirellula sp. SH-Sr6A]|uniref:hypothetical protein n=1 Tax=Pirellula sp. SH-Sr6A TaxID=1632865 RepID=UPI00078C89C3|nr:hypothetical protein [Pirellula sp. SH-Sr6A]AMV33303.1 hypothetical protein VN12_14345 [Pirellula sp. SH-Sr6A]
MRYRQRELLDPNDPSLASLLDSQRGELQQEYRKALAVARRLQQRLRSAPFGEITGVGVELLHKRGLVALPLQFCVTVWVQRKRVAGELLASRRAIPRRRSPSDPVLAIPTTYGGLPVKVQEGVLKFAVDRRETRPRDEDRNAGSSLEAIEPITGGVAVQGNGANRWGTLGLVFRESSQRLVGLTCEHVVSHGDVFPSPDSDGERQPSVGTVLASKRSPRSGVDAASVHLVDQATEGVLGFEELFSEMKFLVTAPARASYWSWLLQVPVSVRGASTGRVVHGRVTMPIVHSIELGGDSFRDLMVIHSRSASSSIVSEGDSGAAVVMQYGSDWVWIGLVVGMIDPYTMVASKLPKAWKGCELNGSLLPRERRWRLGE